MKLHQCSVPQFQAVTDFLFLLECKNNINFSCYLSLRNWKITSISMWLSLDSQIRLPGRPKGLYSMGKSHSSCWNLRDYLKHDVWVYFRFITKNPLSHMTKFYQAHWLLFNLFSGRFQNTWQKWTLTCFGKNQIFKWTAVWIVEGALRRNLRYQAIVLHGLISNTY